MCLDMEVSINILNKYHPMPEHNEIISLLEYNLIKYSPLLKLKSH